MGSKSTNFATIFDNSRHWPAVVSKHSNISETQNFHLQRRWLHGLRFNRHFAHPSPILQGVKMRNLAWFWPSKFRNEATHL